MSRKITNSIRRFFVETEAATSVEYAIILVLIAGACITTIQALGGSTTAFWEGNRDSVEDALNGP